MPVNNSSQKFVVNQYGVYGTYRSNRVVVKRLSQEQRSNVWGTVAGYDRDSVELLRNKIVKEIN